MSAKSGLDTRGIIFLVIGLIAFAFAPIFVRWADNADAIALAVWRGIFSVALISPVYYWGQFRHRKQAVKEIRNSKIFILKVVSGAALGLHFILWIASLSYTSVASSSVLVTIHPILLILVESIFYKVKFNKWIWLGVFVSFLGSVGLGFADNLQSEGDFPDALFGDLLAFLAAAVFAFHFLISNKVRQYSSWIGYVTPIYFWSALTCIVIALLLPGPFFLPETGMWMAFALAFGPQLFGHGAMNYAIKFVNPTILSTTILAEPTLATLFGIYFFNEIPTLTAFLAMIIIILGVSLTWFGNRKNVLSE